MDYEQERTEEWDCKCQYYCNGSEWGYSKWIGLGNIIKSWFGKSFHWLGSFKVILSRLSEFWRWKKIWNEETSW